MSKTSYVQEYKAIVEVMNKYNEGLAKADSAIMKPAFNEKATMFSVDSGAKLNGGPVQQSLFDVVGTSSALPRRRTRYSPPLIS